MDAVAVVLVIALDHVRKPVREHVTALALVFVGERAKRGVLHNVLTIVVMHVQLIVQVTANRLVTGAKELVLILAREIVLEAVLSSYGRKTASRNMNRGRIQAQGDYCEESETWAQVTIPTKSIGRNKVVQLKNKLTQKQQKQRACCFCKVDRLIAQAPQNGYDVGSMSYTPNPPIRDIRVDVEIIKGRAFRD